VQSLPAKCHSAEAVLPELREPTQAAIEYSVTDEEKRSG
jgi:hypothetical protein